MRLFDTFYEHLLAAERIGDLRHATDALKHGLGVAHVFYDWVSRRGESAASLTLSQGWIDRYLTRDAPHADPVVVGALQRFDPFDWKELNWSTRAARTMLRDAKAFGVGSQGYTIPIRGPSGQFALFSLNDTCDDAAWFRLVSAHRHDLILAAYEFHRKVLEFEQGEDTALPSLSPRELAAMTHISRGLSRAQAAAEMAISEHTLRVYIEAARHKLGAFNTTHAVARALSLGLIAADP